jgi:bile acid:Na+ symporter, BASS family
MDLKHLTLLGLQIAVLGTVFGFGLSTTLADLLYVVRRPALLIRSLLSVLVIMPILAVSLVEFLNLRTEVEATLICLAISPVPPLLPKKQRKAGGLQSFGLGLMVVLLLAAIPAIPLSVRLLEFFFARPFVVGTGAIARVVLLMGLLPLAMGLAVRAVFPRIAMWLKEPLAVAANGLLLLGALVLLAGSLTTIWSATGQRAVIAIVSFVILGLLIGHLMGGPETENRAVLALGTACRHPAIALAVATINFPDTQIIGVILLYLITSAIVCIPYVAWQRSRLLATRPD